jgi:hypothetical protein
MDAAKRNFLQFLGCPHLRGVTVAIVGPQWRLVADPPFSGAARETANLAFRLAADGGEDSLLVAAPRIVGPARPLIFGNGFEQGAGGGQGHSPIPKSWVSRSVVGS